MTGSRRLKTAKLVQNKEVAGIRCLEGDCGKISIKLRSDILAGTAQCDFCGNPLKIDETGRKLLAPLKTNT